MCMLLEGKNTILVFIKILYNFLDPRNATFPSSRTFNNLFSNFFFNKYFALLGHDAKFYAHVQPHVQPWVYILKFAIFN